MRDISLAAVGRGILAVALLLSPGAVNGQEVSLARYSTADGLPAPRVTASLQDSRGFLWFGTPAGVARYDGSEFRVFTTADGLSGNDVVALVEDVSGSVLVATRDGGIDAIGGERVVRFAVDPELGPVEAMSFSEQHVYIAGPGLAARLNGDRIEPVAGELPDGCCTAIARDRQGRIWLGSRGGVFVLEAGQVRRLRGIDVEVTALLVTSAGLTIGTREGVFRLEAARAELLDLDLPSRVVRSLTLDPVEGIWVGTDAGAVRLVGGVRDRLTVGSGLPDASVNTTMVDHEGTLWVGTDGGLVKWVPSSFSIYTAAQGLGGDFIVGVIEAEGGGVWVASRSAVVLVDAEGRVVRGPEFRDTHLTAIARVGPTLYVGADDQLLAVRDGDRSSTQVSRLPERIVSLLAHDDDLYIGTERGLYRLVKTIAEPIDLPFVDAITALAADTEGDLWLGTSRNGVWARAGEEFEARPGPQPLPAVWDLEAEDDGTMWAATNGAGVVRWTTTGEPIDLTRARNALVSDFVQQVVVDRDGVLWLYTNRGLDRWDPASGVTHFDLGDGLVSLTGTAGAGVAGADGTLWFGTPSGLTVYRRRAQRAAAVQPEVLIRRVELDGRTVAPERLMTLQSDTDAVAFAFTALTFRDEASTLFRYRLRGRSDSWSSPTGERRIAYVGLPPGDYLFEVQAINDLGVWSETATVPMKISPAAWQTDWFKGVVFVVALVAVAVFFRGRLRRANDERERLRGMVDQRTRELVEKNSLLERMATTDELTGLPNRRFFLESMQRELRKMSRARTDEELSLLVIDLDRFKSINDRFGHPAGDDVLREVARRLSRGVRATDLPARYGGEEFAILLPATATEGARFLAEKLRSDMESLDLRLEGERIPVTISVGVATIDAPERYEPEVEEHLLRRADEAMYEAKESGRNRVVVAS